MSFHQHHNATIHHFFKNKELNELYISYGIHNFALGLILVFVPIYLYDLGYSIPWILFYFFITSISFILLSFWGAKIVAKIGVKHTMLITAPILILYFIGLRYIEFFPWFFFLLPVLRAIKMILYNFSFHLNFISHSEKKERGRQVSTIQACALFASVLSPFFGGLIIKFFNFPTLFIVGSSLLVLGMLPLFFSKESYQKITFEKENLIRNIFKKTNLPLFWSFAGYSIEAWIGVIIWPIFLFILIPQTETVGLLVSLPIILTLSTFYFIGKMTDKKDKKALMKVGTVLHFFGWVARVFAQNFASVFFIDTYKNIAMRVLHVPWSACFYDIAAKGNYFKFIVQRELAFNIARVIAIPFLILIFYIDFYPFVIAFVMASLFSLLYVTINKKLA